MRPRITRRSGGACSGKPCWKPIPSKGYKYGGKGLSSDGVKKLLLKGDVAGKSKILIRGKDGKLPPPHRRWTRTTR